MSDRASKIFEELASKKLAADKAARSAAEKAANDARAAAKKKDAADKAWVNALNDIRRAVDTFNKKWAAADVAFKIEPRMSNTPSNVISQSRIAIAKAPPELNTDQGLVIQGNIDQEIFIDRPATGSMTAKSIYSGPAVGFNHDVALQLLEDYVVILYDGE